MIIGSAIIHGVREIGTHKFRSLLSMIGIILGVAALVAMVGVVEGMMSGFRKTFEGTGGIEKLEIERAEPPMEQEAIAHRSPKRTMKDYYALQAAVPSARRVSAEKNVDWSRLQSDTKREWVRMRGTTPETFEIERFSTLPGGRLISDWDVEQRNRVIVLANRNARTLFGNAADALGKTVSTRGIVFTVIGVLEPDDTGSWSRSRVAFIPISTAIHYFAEPDDDTIQDLGLQAERMEDIPVLTDQIERTLLVTHRGIKDFAVETRTEELEEFQKLERSFVYSLGGVAAITLLVGGIGIANVMLASISERIREIGIRKAVGARGGDIFIQFVAEALVISVIGGLLGIIASVGLVELLRSVMPEDTGHVALSAKAMGWGFLFSMIVGFCSGVFPAIKAARLPVIDALRYE
ncbi:ABC transporter permease [Cerasicoccus arenae]|uniref:Multidrug ABC transporter substrate-binding protein n=1 Tax=Cerasicoccus arenae TaxID=424488 RepID=A0A8J3GG57_9BACT|nr:ABC transporter permease [Cerasicoccus arenae]MBK1856832.1 ABC transporter permease [Cerasicoccus arenae]GHC11146.1 multidrug ABC transporter substrate-binding protein [Cerasicoccus arenae]